MSHKHKTEAKTVSERMKFHGLKKLKWWCQLCEKQCYSDYGFEDHSRSEGHSRMVMLFQQNPSKYIQRFSDEFQESFIDILRTRYGTNRVNANRVYQEFIASDKKHVHMNATRWTTLSDFCQYLGREAVCRVEPGDENEPHGTWYLEWIDRDPLRMRLEKEAEMHAQRRAQAESNRRRDALAAAERARQAAIQAAIDAGQDPAELEVRPTDLAWTDEHQEALASQLQLGTEAPAEDAAATVADAAASGRARRALLHSDSEDDGPEEEDDRDPYGLDGPGDLAAASAFSSGPGFVAAPLPRGPGSGHDRSLDRGRSTGRGPELDRGRRPDRDRDLGRHPDFDRRGRSPDRRGRSPDRRGRSPDRRGRSPDRRGRSPDRRGRSPDRRGRSPDRRGRSPDRRGRSPDRRGQSPDRRGRSPDRRGRSPDRRGRSPDRRGRSPDRRDRTLAHRSRSPDRRRSRSPDRRRSRSPDRRRSRSPDHRRRDRSADRQRSPAGRGRSLERHRSRSPDHRRRDRSPGRRDRIFEHDRQAGGLGTASIYPAGLPADAWLAPGLLVSVRPDVAELPKHLQGARGRVVEVFDQFGAVLETLPAEGASGRPTILRLDQDDLRPARPGPDTRRAAVLAGPHRGVVARIERVTGDTAAILLPGTGEVAPVTVPLTALCRLA
ncbi:hypothetical protein H696_03569 [Fonticula alba]|uniref:DNA/RNA-binding protein Kin17 WH-like domain-containing protein n=1 Tax=Fonticula alba TaxID=691883 RepID=A0A058Z9B5_FONAL|nr:hypothetical protein H696_03569 [Fonticula alba]KCV70107.1 hypothetical protein H696_03569 [Fonticula alba]|eukprot:XP_009495713.1 hypothetical protein H696_03569 [Fonticula alba]